MARNARLVAAYEERLATGQVEAPQRRLLAVDNVMSSIAAAKAAAAKLRQRQDLKLTLAEQAYATSQYFRRQKVIVGVSYVLRADTTNLSTAVAAILLQHAVPCTDITDNNKILITTAKERSDIPLFI